jgi:tetrahydromethanopterin S-methyltransferase subunit G
MKEDKPAVEEDPYADIPEHIMKSDVETIKLQTRLIDNEVKVYFVRYRFAQRCGCRC